MRHSFIRDQESSERHVHDAVSVWAPTGKDPTQSSRAEGQGGGVGRKGHVQSEGAPTSALIPHAASQGLSSIFSTRRKIYRSYSGKLTIGWVVDLLVIRKLYGLV